MSGIGPSRQFAASEWFICDMHNECDVLRDSRLYLLRKIKVSKAD